MRSFAWLRARPRTLASAGVVSVAAVAITTLAFVYDGLPTTEVDLHDGALRTPSQDYDILQSGATVLMVDAENSTVSTVDPANVALTEPADLPGSAVVALGGQTVAVPDPAKGGLWVAPAGGSLKIKGVDPLVELGKGAGVAVGLDGTVYAVSPEKGEIVIVRTDAEGEPGDPESRA